MKVRPTARWSITVAVLLLLTGCGSSARLATDTQAVERNLRAEARSWQGAPHRLGGTTKRGVDCSGLVQVVFDDLFDVQLPRTTEDQVHVGDKVRRSGLTPGDLVFFRPTPKSRHVGIYVGNGEFFHVSSSQGAMISRLEEPYWRQRYWTARRVLNTRYVAEVRPGPTATAPDGW